MNDFEDRLRRLLNEDVDARLGEQRPAPPRRFRAAKAPGRHAHRPARSRGRTRWLPPLIAAAVIVVALAGTAAAGELLSSPDRRVDPATVEPSRSAPPSSSTPPTTPTTSPSSRPVTRTTPRSTPGTRTGAPAPTKRRSTSSGPQVHTVKVGKAIIALPAGWVSRDLAGYYGSGGSGPAPGRCLTPSSSPVSTADDACPVILYDVTTSRTPISADTEGGFVSDPHPCGQFENSVKTESGHRQFGGRRSTWHHWDHDCKRTSDKHVEQYVITAKPSYVLYSDHADKDTVAVMATIAAESQLPQ